MKKVILSATIVAGLLLSVAAANAGMVCYSNNARNMGPWGWQSCNPDPNAAQSIASQGALNACQQSANTFNPATCRITSCSYVACGYPAYPAVSGTVFTCTAVGAYGHRWYGSGPNMTNALNNSVYNCRNGGGVNCQASANSCVAQ